MQSPSDSIFASESSYIDDSSIEDLPVKSDSDDKIDRSDDDVRFKLLDIDKNTNQSDSDPVFAFDSDEYDFTTTNISDDDVNEINEVIDIKTEDYLSSPEFLNLCSIKLPYFKFISQLNYPNDTCVNYKSLFTKKLPKSIDSHKSSSKSMRKVKSTVGKYDSDDADSFISSDDINNGDESDVGSSDDNGSISGDDSEDQTHWYTVNGRKIFVKNGREFSGRDAYREYRKDKSISTRSSSRGKSRRKTTRSKTRRSKSRKRSTKSAGQSKSPINSIINNINKSLKGPKKRKSENSITPSSKRKRSKS